jgi:hypothetical protein
MTSLAALPNAILFAATGLLLFAAAVAILIRILPSNLWNRATMQSDTAAAIIVATLLAGLAWIIAAAVH